MSNIEKNCNECISYSLSYEKNFETTINICHKDWNDIIILDSCKNTLYRMSNNNETGKYIINDNILLK